MAIVARHLKRSETSGFAAAVLLIPPGDPTESKALVLLGDVAIPYPVEFPVPTSSAGESEATTTIPIVDKEPRAFVAYDYQSSSSYWGACLANERGSKTCSGTGADWST